MDSVAERGWVHGSGYTVQHSLVSPGLGVARLRLEVEETGGMKAAWVLVQPNIVFMFSGRLTNLNHPLPGPPNTRGRSYLLTAPLGTAVVLEVAGLLLRGPASPSCSSTPCGLTVRDPHAPPGANIWHLCCGENF